jgi:hypothetical protein
MTDQKSSEEILYLQERKRAELVKHAVEPFIYEVR